MRPDVIGSFDRARTPGLALARWEAVDDSLEPVRESENFVYRFRDPAGAERYLRLTHESRRTPLEINLELHFVSYLADAGIPVAKPVLSRDGNAVETIDTLAGQVHAVAFEAVYGKPVKWGTDKENRAILFERGTALGRIHKLSSAYLSPARGRLHWHEDNLFTDPARYFPEAETAARREYEELVAWLAQRPRTRDNYGMIHGDYGSFNTFRLDGGGLVTIDFDDCCFHWFTYDLAVAIRSARKLPEHYRIAYARVLLEGYATTKDLCGDGAEEIAKFSRLAALYRFVWTIRKFGHAPADERHRKLLNDRRKVLANPPRWY